MRFSKRVPLRWRWLLGLLLVLGIASIMALRLRHGSAYGLPYADGFRHGTGDGWTAYGGTWQIADDAMQNISDERGAKLLNGSPFWTDYAIESDLRLDGESGDAGLMLRVQDPDEGVDAFHGFYTGLRLRDNALIAGDADYGWTELAVQPLKVKLKPFQWYHLLATVRGCRLQVSAFTQGRVPIASLDLQENGCSERGQIGLRSYASGGSWKNLRVYALRSQRGHVG